MVTPEKADRLWPDCYAVLYELCIYKIREFFWVKPILPNSALLNFLPISSITNYQDGLMYVCSVKISDGYVWFPGTTYVKEKFETWDAVGKRV